MSIRQKMSLALVCACVVGAAAYFGLDNQTDARDKIWSEKDPNAPALVNLPNLAPIIDQLDPTIVHIATSSEPKKRAQRGGRPGPGPNQLDPFLNPEEFFERFFGQPFQMPEQQQQPRRSLGSGFIISKDGYIVTNNHVIDGADKIEVALYSKEKKRGPEAKENIVQAKLVGADPATDVALLKIDLKRDLPFAYLGDSNQMTKGDWVLALGNPFGLDHSVSLGIISATGREISPNANTRRFDDFIQTDAAINFGNSGGPLVNLRGEVIAINTAITAQGSGIGFAVPVNIAKDIISQLKTSGTVTRGYLGVQIQDITDEVKEALQLGSNRGVLVNDIMRGGPADGSELRRGDVIQKINGQETTDSRALQQIVARIKPGDTARIEVLREKKTLTLNVKVGRLEAEGAAESQKDSSKEQKFDPLGLIVSDGADGVVIQAVDPEGVAAMAGLERGDIIRRINRSEIKSTKDYRSVTGKLKSKQSVELDIQRQDMKVFIYLRLP